MYRQIVDGFNGLPRDLAWRVKPGVNPNAVFILILECGHSYAFHDLEVPGPKPRLSISRSELSGHVAVYTEGEFCQTCGEAFESHTLLD